MDILFLILNIFKIILITILVLVILILILPLKYDIKVDYYEKLRLNIDINYGFKIIHIIYSLDNENVLLKIFGINISRFIYKNSNRKSEKESFQDKEIYIQSIQNPKKENTIKEQSNLLKKENKSKKEKNTKNNHKSVSFGKFKNIKKVIKNKVEIIKCVKKLIKDLIKLIGIKKAYIKSDFGFSDPSTTGIVLGSIYSFSYLFSKIDLDLNPNFENEIFNISGEISGKFSIFKVGFPTLKSVLKIYKLIK